MNNQTTAVTGWTVENTLLKRSQDGGEAKSFLCRGMCYQNTPVGAFNRQFDAGFIASEVWKDDLDKMRDMGVNTVKIYNIDKKITREKDEHGKDTIKVVFGDITSILEHAWYKGDRPIHFLLTSWIRPLDLGFGKDLAELKSVYRALVAQFCAHPAVMGFSIGSEVNPDKDKDTDDVIKETRRDTDAFWQDFKSIADAARTELASRNSAKILTSGLIYDCFRKDVKEYQTSSMAFALKNLGAQTLDVWGIDVYPGPSEQTTVAGKFGFYDVIKEIFAAHNVPLKPVLVAEFGEPASGPHLPKGKAYERADELKTEAEKDKYHQRRLQFWEIIEKHWAGSGVMTDGTNFGCGGCIFEWCDEWWKQTADYYAEADNPCDDRHHNSSTKSSFLSTTDPPDPYVGLLRGYYDEEWFGLFKLKTENDGTVTKLIERPIYNHFKMNWTDGKNKIYDKQTLNQDSDWNPALASIKDKLYLAWKGTDRDNSLNFMYSDDGLKFGGLKTISSSSSHAPALCVHDEKLFVAWKGNGNNSLNVAQIELKEDGSVTGLKNIKTLSETSSHGPALVSFNQRLYLAWKGDGNDSLNVMFSADGGLSFGHKLASKQNSQAPPVLCVHTGKLYIGWKGGGNNSLNLGEITVEGETIKDFSAETSTETSHSTPALTSAGNRLFIAWRGTDNFLNTLKYKKADTKYTSGESSQEAPVLCTHNGKVFIAWKGNGNNHLNVGQLRN